ncbi:35893_t:CDS:2, partial [Gigaspora margarita]
LEDMIKNSKLDDEIPTIKTVEGTEDNSLLQELLYNKESDKESNSILNSHSGQKKEKT